MERLVFLIDGTLCYLSFLGIFLYAVGFLGNFGVSNTIDGQSGVPVWQALAINSILLGIFAIQHSVMARQTFKQCLPRYIPKSIERSTYMLCTNIALALLFYAWQPMGGKIWHIQDPVGQGLLYGLFAAGWGLILMATFLINHFDFFGMRQVWLYLRKQEYTPLPFKTPALLSAGTASSLCWLALGLLGHSHDDGCPSGLFGDDNHLYPDGHSMEREGFGGFPWRAL